MSDDTTRVVPNPVNAVRSVPMPERSAPPMSRAPTDGARRSAAWIAVALVFSRYAGVDVANHSESTSTFAALRRALRAASAPMVVVSSS